MQLLSVSSKISDKENELLFKKTKCVIRNHNAAQDAEEIAWCLAS